MPLNALTLYATQADVASILSPLGVQLRLDDNNDGVVDASEQRSMTFALGDAAETINFYCYQQHTPAQLATSNWVNIRAAWLGAYALCDRRGNPPPDSVVDRCEKIEKELELILNGTRTVPGIPLRLAMAPRWSNWRIQPGFQFRVIRVERKTSGPQPGHQTQLPQVTDYESDNFYEL